MVDGCALFCLDQAFLMFRLKEWSLDGCNCLLEDWMERRLNVLPLLFVRSVLPFGSFPNCYIYPHLQIVGG